MNIFVSNVGFHVESEDLKNLFTPFGAVTSAHIVKDKETGKSLRYGFVEMTEDKGADEAISKLNGRIIEGRAMSVSKARNKDNPAGKKTLTIQ